MSSSSGIDITEKKPSVAKSCVIFDVKPMDEEVNLDEVAQKVFLIQPEGLLWKSDYQKVHIAYGIFKLVITCIVEDDKVSVDEIIDRILELEDEVQSVDIAAFQKI